MPGRWLVPVLLALAAPSGFGGSAAASFGIELQLQAAAGAPPPGTVPGTAPSQDGGLTTCSSASAASSVRVNCSTPTFVEISDDRPGATRNARAARTAQELCGQLTTVPGITCVSSTRDAVEHPADEGVSLPPAETALRLDDPGLPASPGAIYEIRRRDSLSTLVAVQTVDPGSRTVELLVTF